MESISQIIGQSQVTGRQGRSQTYSWVKTTKICTVCGKEFTATKTMDACGTVVLPGREMCDDCYWKSKNEEFIREAQDKLSDEIKTQRQLWRVECKIPGVFADKSFDTFDGKLQPAALKAIKSYNGKSIILASPDLYGVGKTHLAAALANHLINTSEAVKMIPDGRYIHNRCPVFFIAETVLLARIRNTYNGNTRETEEDIYSKMADYPLLIIDDVGKVRPKDYSFLQGVYFRIIDDRYSNQRPVILTTNLDFPGLEEHIGGACADRMKEMCGKANLVKMTGKSYRGS
jgi:DNA replication protein DnaC